MSDEKRKRRARKSDPLPIEIRVSDEPGDGGNPIAALARLMLSCYERAVKDGRIVPERRD